MKKMLLSAALAGLAAMQLIAATISPAPYGINVHLAGNDTLEKVKAAGITWIRIDINWDMVEPGRGQFNFSPVDRVVDYAFANGLSILASIAYTPAWANGEKENWIAYPAVDVNNWRGFVERVINRYKHAVKYWSIWNEPNLKDFFVPGKDVFVQQVLLPAAQVIRQADPTAFIVGPDLSHKTETGMEWYFWLKYILDKAGVHFDVISHHIYEDLGVYYMYEQLEEGDNVLPAVKQIIEESGQGGKPFWITETGWNTSKFSEAMQSSRYLDMLQTRARKNYPQKIFFYEIIDDPEPSVPPWGIIRSDGEAKPAYHTYRDYIAGLYPDQGDPDDEIESKKCYAEQILTNAPGSSKTRSLQKLRNLRDDLGSYSTGARGKVNIYYELNQAFLKMAMTDSRLADLSREILARVLKLPEGGSGLSLSQPLPATLSSKIEALLEILDADYRDSVFGRLAARLLRNPAAIGQIPLGDLLDLDLHDDGPAAGKALP